VSCHYDRILLIGMMGAGKSTIGHALSTVLGWPYYDNDQVLRRAVGKDTRAVQETDGLGALRRAESAALGVALDSAGPLIAGVAGGVVTQPLDLDRLTRSGAFVVWLRVGINTLSSRVAGTDRPWLAAGPEHAMRTLYAGREALYAGAATYVVDNYNTSADLIAREIATAACRDPAH
jgi:shikimate kinase